MPFQPKTRANAVLSSCLEPHMSLLQFCSPFSEAGGAQPLQPELRPALGLEDFPTNPRASGTRSAEQAFSWPCPPSELLHLHPVALCVHSGLFAPAFMTAFIDHEFVLAFYQFLSPHPSELGALPSAFHKHL